MINTYILKKRETFGYGFYSDPFDYHYAHRVDGIFYINRSNNNRIRKYYYSKSKLVEFREIQMLNKQQNAIADII